MHLTDHTTTLRRLSPNDLRPFQAYRADPDVAQYQSWEPMDDARALGFLHAMAQFDPILQPGHWTQIAVVDAATDALLGDMGIHLSEESTKSEIGITLARSAQGQGHAVRSVALAVRYLFDMTPILRINAWADIRNPASIALMERSGFTLLRNEVTDGIEEAAFELRREAS